MNNKVLIIGLIWPEPDSTAAGERIMQLIEVFQKNNFRIIFVSTASKSEKSFPFETLHIETHKIEINSSSFDRLVIKIDPSIVVFDRFITEEQFGWKITENCPEALKILDTEDLHFLRNARQNAFIEKKKVNLKYLTNDISKREIASIFRCDLSLIISKYEMNLLTNEFKINNDILLYLPFLIDNIDENIFSHYPAFKERIDFITIGNFKHKPNKNSVKYLKETIWPLIRSELPNARLNVYGAYIPEYVKQLHSEKDGFIIKGWAKDKEEVFTKSRVCLAPLNFGAGLKGKLIDSMQYGTPNVTTSLGAESMHDLLEWNGFIKDDPKEFALGAVKLYGNEKIWKNSQKNGVTIINQCYDKKNFSKKLLQKVMILKKNIDEHRLGNFIGSMLNHHTMQSTKYLSKWIETKNTRSK